MDRIVKIGLGLGALWLAFRIAVKNIVIGVKKVSLYGLDLANGIAAIRLDVSVQNPLPFGVTVKDITGTVYAGGMKIGSVNTRLDYFCGSERTHILPVIVNLSAKEMGAALWQNIQSGNIDNLVIDFDGQLHITRFNITIPLELSFSWREILG